MESSGPGALALQAAPHTPEPRFRVTRNHDTTNQPQKAVDKNTAGDEEQQQPMTSFSTPVHNPNANHFDPSHVRETVEQPQQSSPTSTDAAHILANPDFRHPSAADPFAAVSEDPFARNGASAGVDEAALEAFAFPNGNVDSAGAERWVATGYDDGEFAVDDEPFDDHPDMQAFAKLVFADGDYFVTTTTVGLGRDMEFEKSWKRKRKLERAWERQSQQAVRAFEAADAGSDIGQLEGDAERAEPSSSKGSRSLEGRPAKGLPSNYSEQGGVVSYAEHSDTEMDSRRARRKRRHLYSKASSDTTSVAPASLHTTTMWPNLLAEESGANLGLSRAFIPVHPVAGREDDIKKVSKEHVIISYNFDEERWEAEIKGKYCWVNDTNYARGDIVPLGHHTRFEFVGIFFNFKLPDQERASPGPSRGTFSEYGGVDDDDDDDGEDEDEDGEDALQTSPAARKLSGAIDVDDSDDDTPLAAARADKKPSKIKLKLKNPLAEKKRQGAEAKKAKEEKKAAKLAAKQQRKEEKRQAKEAREAASQSPEVSRKGKKPKEASKQPGKAPAKQPAPPGSVLEATSADNTGLSRVETPRATAPEQVAAGIKQEDGKPGKEKASPPAPPPIIIEAGSVLEGVAAEAMPERRKGPGRPPKNGLISKRDQAFIRRKTKEFEKMGREVPPLNVLLDIVRAENKAREAAQKAAARGEAPPPESAVVQSIELEPSLTMAHQPPRQEPSASTEGVLPTMDDQRPSATPMSHMQKPPSPKPKRVVKSPSPMKPESAFSEEELKKPSATYVVILDEILKAHPQGQADLQEIYDLICKRYPYFKYRSGTNGWQSSVRHNLLQNERFKENGRSGKGKLWAINHEIPLEREKKRRLTPPPRPPMANGQQYSQYPPYGNPNYQYGPPGSNQQGRQYGSTQVGPGDYHSPYGQGTQVGYGQQYGQQQQNGIGQPSNGASSGASQQPQQTNTPAPQAPGEFQSIVDEIMAYRAQYLAGAQGEELDRRTNVFQKCINITSDVFHGQNKEAAKPEGPAEIEVCTALDQVFERHGNLKPTASQSATPAADASQTTQIQGFSATDDSQGPGQSASAATPAGPAGNAASARQISNGAAHAAALQPQQSISEPGNSVLQSAYPQQAPSAATQAVEQHAQKGAHTQSAQANPSTSRPQASSTPSQHSTPAINAPADQQQGQAPQARAQAQASAPHSSSRQWPPQPQQGSQQDIPQQQIQAPSPNAAAPPRQANGQPQRAPAALHYQRATWPSTQPQGPEPSYNGTPASQQTPAQLTRPGQPQPSMAQNDSSTDSSGRKSYGQAAVAPQQTNTSTRAPQAQQPPSIVSSQTSSRQAPLTMSQSASGAPPPTGGLGQSSQGQHGGVACASGQGVAHTAVTAERPLSQSSGSMAPAQSPLHALNGQAPARQPQTVLSATSSGAQSQPPGGHLSTSVNGVITVPPTQSALNGSDATSRPGAESETSTPAPMPPQMAPTPSPALTPVKQSATPASVRSESKPGTPVSTGAAAPASSPKKRAAEYDEEQMEAAKRLKTD